MTDFKAIYRQRAAEYDRMVSFEDHEGNLARVLGERLDLEGARVVEVGAGTGRLTRIVAPLARWVIALDRSGHMLDFAARRGVGPNVRWLQADFQLLPLADRCADIALAGWALGHSIEWFEEDWRPVVARALAEMRRTLRPGGWLAIFETLGTGRETPQAPTPGLAHYYQLLEDEYGFDRFWLRTDYAFESPEQGAEAVRFFFGDELAQRMLREHMTVLPECTGLWLRRR